VPGHRCKNKCLYSLCILEDDEDIVEVEGEADIVKHDLLTPPYFSQCSGGYDGLPHIKSSREG